MADIKKIAEELVILSVKDVSELANILKDEYGIEPAAAATVVAGGGAAGGGAAEAAEEKTSFNITLKSAGASKDAKDMVDGAPKAIKEGVPKDEAESAKKQLEEAGAEVELG